MQLDYITIKQIHSEIQEHLVGAFVRDILPHDIRGIVFILKSADEMALLISADPDNSRIHLIGKTQSRGRKSDEHFHRTVRHHLAGGTVNAFELIDGERVIEIHVSKKEFSGEIRNYKFIAELMGRHSNLVLVDEQNLIIVSDHTQIVDEKKSREIRPGKIYQTPSSDIKIPLNEYSLDDFTKFFQDSDQTRKWGKLLISSFKGITPGFIKAIANEAGVSEGLRVDELDDQTLSRIHRGYLNAVIKLKSGDLFPPFDELIIISDEAKPGDKFPLNKAVERFYVSQTADKSRNARVSHWKQAVNVRIKSLNRLIENLAKDSEKASKADGYRKQGDLIFIYINQFKPGVREVEVDDILDPESDEKFTLELLPGKDAAASAREYHKRASKLGRGLDEIESRLEKAREELTEFESNIEPPDDILALKDDEFEKAVQSVKTGKGTRGLKSSRKKFADDKAALPKKLHGLNVHRYVSKEGIEIFVGGNETANEALYRWGNPDDYWLHVKNIQGSHVLVPKRGETIDHETLVFAAQLAIYYSRVKGATKIPVDYTLLKYVKKPPDSPPGYVTYSKEKSILADSPDEKELKKRQGK